MGTAADAAGATILTARRAGGRGPGLRRTYNPPVKTSCLGLAMLCVLGAVAARADVYRCTVDGKAVYTDKPCAVGAVPAQLPPVTTVDRQPLGTPLERQFDADARHEAEVKRRARIESVTVFEAGKAHADAVRRAIAAHRAIKGMTMAEVRQALGEPSEIAGSGAINERWNYFNGRDRQTLTFDNGILKSDRVGQARHRRYR